MQAFKTLFHQRIKINEEPSFGTLSSLLQKFAEAIPFENLRIIEHRQSHLSKEGLQEKILIQNEGGVCYELNTLLYHYLNECGWDVTLLSACIYDQKSNDWSNTGNTHVTILLHHDGEKYIVDAGFGANIALAPVPLAGNVVKTANGQFRIKRAEENYKLELKLADRDKDWRIGYRFSLGDSITHLAELQKMQQIIETHPNSPFNKSKLLTRRTSNGLYVLTPSSFTEWQDGVAAKQTIVEEEYTELLHTKFHI
ncbi:N-hydroxyarylamine O-acetyltransferase [Terribacillus halophilus]|uniref:N-hydroxyarylamine O-acetyltransferase n=1 Tax=Terribacillus halophilus TaxID=361279 RepID=A0A1G6PVG7_9BACI|nr:arylamine N-acetyltransferase [Terribacillus halophilus]SDC84210.1 N-hydroxyarylamine O-acetyltransferase [Terribacillus halophilus]